MKIPITFLGTSQAIPTAKRNHTAVLLQYKTENILIDCGEGTQRQFRKAKLNPCKLTRILITHWHGDHILGLPGLLQTLALNGYNKTLHIYIPKATKKFIDLIYNLFVFQGKIKLQIHEVSSGKILETPDFFIESFKMDHGTPTNSYSFTEKEKIRLDKNKIEKLKIKGKILGELAKGKNITHNNKTIKASSITYTEPGRKIAFIFDTKINENCYKTAKDSDLLICESTYTEKEKELASERKHLTAKQAAEIAKKSNSKKLILSHISQRYQANDKPILKEAQSVFKNTIIAEDLMKIEV